MPLTLVLLALAAVAFWAGYRAPPHPLQYLSRFGFVSFVALAVFAGYFAWRGQRTLDELSELVDPVPEITRISYVPTAAEVRSIARFLATVPDREGRGFGREEREDFADRAAERTTEYWHVKTRLPADSVFSFYRATAPRRGWRIDTDDPPWLALGRDGERLLLFVTDDPSGPETTVLYAASPGS